MDYDEREPSEPKDSTPTTRPCEQRLTLCTGSWSRSPGGWQPHNGPMAWEWVSPVAAAGGGVLGGGLGAQRIRVWAGRFADRHGGELAGI